ncbi:MAG: hypothetical protein L0H79_14005 [Intrasporangium sp.]|uniref:hypothetical protein n=1 Tax=Intrasporangium sp. TaxID=1925024 RepID=UPI002649BE5F|nr:hypothetical protein [Intrasporangium sp.]MDN5796854.1 hypothetical protein [Intrasporangium sp.]
MSSSDVPPPPEPYRYAAEPAFVASDRERWPARRTALVAGATVVLVSAGTIAAAATVPLGDSSRGVGTAT